MSGLLPCSGSNAGPITDRDDGPAQAFGHRDALLRRRRSTEILLLDRRRSEFRDSLRRSRYALRHRIRIELVAVPTRQLVDIACKTCGPPNLRVWQAVAVAIHDEREVEEIVWLDQAMGGGELQVENRGHPVRANAVNNLDVLTSQRTPEADTDLERPRFLLDRIRISGWKALRDAISPLVHVR